MEDESLQGLLGSIPNMLGQLQTYYKSCECKRNIGDYFKPRTVVALALASCTQKRGSREEPATIHLHVMDVVDFHHLPLHREFFDT